MFIIIYLDAAATSKYKNVDDIIVDTMTTAMRDSWQNPSSLYATKVKDKINKCRESIANFIGAKPEEIYFTSGSSESNSWVIQGFVKSRLFEGNTGVITSKIEHKSIIECVENLDHTNVYYVDVDSTGIVDIKQLESLILQAKRFSVNKDILVSIQLANNEIGTIQSLREIANLTHKYGCVLHTDATQAVGHIPIDVEKLGIDMMSVSGHKISPVLRGIGFLYKRNDINIKPLIYGTQESGLRGGTENTYGIIGLSKALEYCDISYEKIAKMRSKRDYFIEMLETKFGCKLNGPPVNRLPNNVNVTFPQNITGESLLYILSMSDVFISTGSACNSHSIKPSHVLEVIGLSSDDAMKSVRFSLPEDITYHEIDKVIIEIEKSLKLLEV